MKCLLPVIALFCLLVLEVQSCCNRLPSGACCGNGPCNVFCCNCDGGCRRPCDSESLRWLGAKMSKLDENRMHKIEETAAYFAQVDNNSDGLISFEEASSFLGEHPVVRRDVGGETPEWFSKIDVDRNGFISPAEFDSKLA